VLAWPALTQGRHLLLLAPTGSGKTLAAVLPLLGRLLERPEPGLRVLYVAPLKALTNDLRRNLEAVLAELPPLLPQGARLPRLGLRTGDTGHHARRRQLADPPELLLTTPESLAVLLSKPEAAAPFAAVEAVVVDELHALLPTKRGADLAVSLERLEH